jgi:hypothetical protein
MGPLSVDSLVLELGRPGLEFASMVGGTDTRLQNARTWGTVDTWKIRKGSSFWVRSMRGSVTSRPPVLWRRVRTVRTEWSKGVQWGSKRREGPLFEPSQVLSDPRFNVGGTAVCRGGNIESCKFTALEHILAESTERLRRAVYFSFLYPLVTDVHRLT